MRRTASRLRRAVVCALLGAAAAATAGAEESAVPTPEPAAAPTPDAPAAIAPELPAEVVDGREVMLAVDRRPRGPDQRMRMVWRLVEPSGREHSRETRSYWRDYRGGDGKLRSKLLVVFDAPPDVRETAFLVWSYRGEQADDDRWIYLPALRKVRRVAGKDRGRSFAGTEFSYDDLGDRDVDDDTHLWLRTETSAGRALHVIQATARDAAAPHPRRLLWVDAEKATVSRVEYFDRHDRLEKVLDAEWQEADGILDWRRLEMRNVRSGRRTVIEVAEVAHGLGLPDDAFSESALPLGGR